jgi:hypothetical protein
MRVLCKPLRKFIISWHKLSWNSYSRQEICTTSTTIWLNSRSRLRRVSRAPFHFAFAPKRRIVYALFSVGPSYNIARPEHKAKKIQLQTLSTSAHPFTAPLLSIHRAWNSPSAAMPLLSICHLPLAAPLLSICRAPTLHPPPALEESAATGAYVALAPV